ncbi:MAG: hypothetical protein K6A23_08425 [Butyrivibrio sp.]|nr:hypothetical protein [Butyrivibrio sp.]
MKKIFKRMAVLILSLMLAFTVPLSVEAKGTGSFSSYVNSKGLYYKKMPKQYRQGYKMGKKQFKSQSWQTYEMSYDILYGKDWFLQDHTAIYGYTAGALSVQQAKQTYKAATRLAKKAKGKSSQYKKALALHNALINNTSYMSGQYSGQTAYEALVCKGSVCAGYARAYKLLCDICGIPCYCVYGNAGGGLGGGGAHQWNVIKLNGQWYEVDVTFDEGISQNGTISKEFFCLSTAKMSSHVTSNGMGSYHQRCGLDTSTEQFNRVVPVANGTKYQK